jgi:ABC-2 type transport system ATP-binding protein
LLTHADRLAFGYMPEQRGLYPKMRVRDHRVYLARLHGLTTGQAAAAGDRWLRRLGIGANAYERVEALSHGNQQRLQLAAALVHDPQVPVMDEPFSGLDPLGIEDVAGVLRELAEMAPGDDVVVAAASRRDTPAPRRNASHQLAGQRPQAGSVS